MKQSNINTQTGATEDLSIESSEDSAPCQWALASAADLVDAAINCGSPEKI